MLQQGLIFVDPGATAYDSVAGDLTSAIQIQSFVNTTMVGAFTVTYSAVDPSGNRAEATREVIIVSINPPAASSDASSDGGGQSMLLIIIAVTLGCLLLGVIVGFVLRRRRKPGSVAVAPLDDSRTYVFRYNFLHTLMLEIYFTLALNCFRASYHVVLGYHACVCVWQGSSPC